MVDEPFVSVVMPSYNQRQFIEQSIESVLGQEYGHLELIIADGASTDGTVDLLHELSQKDKRLKWLSKPDTGPAEAINRALDLSSGTLIGSYLVVHFECYNFDQLVHLTKFEKQNERFRFADSDLTLDTLFLKEAAKGNSFVVFQLSTSNRTKSFVSS